MLTIMWYIQHRNLALEMVFSPKGRLIKLAMERVEDRYLKGWKTCEIKYPFMPLFAPFEHRYLSSLAYKHDLLSCCW